MPVLVKVLKLTCLIFFHLLYIQFDFFQIPEAHMIILINM